MLKKFRYIYAGGLPFELTEGDVVCIFSQYGEILDINLVRDKKTGKSKGLAFLRYEDQRSTVLAVDNLTGAKVLGKSLRVDHVSEYKQPKRDADDLEEWEQDPRTSMNVAPASLLPQLSPEQSNSHDRSNSGGLMEEDFTKDIDPDDPMFDYLVNERRKNAQASKERSSRKSDRTWKRNEHDERPRHRSRHHRDSRSRNKEHSPDTRHASTRHRSRRSSSRSRS